MATSYQKGNKHSFLFLLIGLCAAGLFAMVSELMLTDGVRTGRYHDPQLASRTVAGTIYDASGSALAIEVPSYSLILHPSELEDAQAACQVVSLYTDSDPSLLYYNLRYTREKDYVIAENIEVKAVSDLMEDLAKTNPEGSFELVKTYTRTYPDTIHAAELIYQTEQTLDKELRPRPGFNEAVTYGKNISLTVRLEMQYLLDVASQALQDKTGSDIMALLLDYETGEVLGMTTTPLATPPEIKAASQLAFSDSIEIDSKILNPYFMTNPDKTPVYGYSELGYQYSTERFNSLMTETGSGIIARFPDRDKPRFLLIMVSESTIDDSLWDEAAYEVYRGLSSQGHF